jgi:hypothetical protein
MGRGPWSTHGNFPTPSLQPSNSARGFVDKTEARLAPGCVQLYSEAINGTDVLLRDYRGD